MKERLRASDYRFILICAALLAATTWFSVRNFYRAFPEASIDFKVSRDDARNIAARFLGDQGYRLEGYRAGRAVHLTTRRPRRFWNARPAWSAPTGSWGHASACGAGPTAGSVRCRRKSTTSKSRRADRLAGFAHELPEDAARPAATAAQARALAEDFLRTRLAARPRVARFRRGHRRRAPASRGPHLHLERARFRVGRRHQPHRGHGPRQRGRAAIAST